MHALKENNTCPVNQCIYIIKNKTVIKYDNGLNRNKHNTFILILYEQS
jgi:hypothetical protein